MTVVVGLRCPAQMALLIELRIKIYSCFRNRSRQPQNRPDQLIDVDG